MAPVPIRFNDGEAYDRAMGPWSRLVGEQFLDWLAPWAGLRWIDIGCGNGVFTEEVMRRCALAEVQRIDPSDAQITFARKRFGASGAAFQNKVHLPSRTRGQPVTVYRSAGICRRRETFARNNKS